MDEAASRLRIEIDSLPQEIDEVERRIVQLEIERQALLKEKDKARASAWPRSSRRSPSSRERSSTMKAQWQTEKEVIQRHPAAQGGARQPEERGGAGTRQRATCSVRPSCATAGSPSSSGSSRRRNEQRLAEIQATAKLPEGGGGRGGHRRDRVQVDRHPGDQDAGERARAARPPGGRAGAARRRAARRPSRPWPTPSGGAAAGLGIPTGRGLVHLPRPHRRGQDRDRPRPGRVPVRRRAGDGAASTCRSTWRSTRWRG